jgi:hypothetical protein
MNLFHNENYDQFLVNKYKQMISFYLEAISDAQRGLAGYYRSFELKERLRPVECDEIRSVLQGLLLSVREFGQLLKDDKNIPQVAASKRYKVYISVSYIENHLKEVLALVSALRAICLESSQETYETLEEIRGGTKVLLRESEVLVGETKEMLTKIHVGNSIAFPAWPHRADYEN